MPRSKAERIPLDAPLAKRPPRLKGVGVGGGAPKVMTAQKLPPDLVAEVRELLALDADVAMQNLKQPETWTSTVETGLRRYVATARARHPRKA